MGLLYTTLWSEHLRRAAQIRHESGPVELLRRILRRTRDMAFKKGDVVFFSRDISGSVPAPTNPIELRQATRGDLAWLMTGADPSQQMEHLAERFSRGDWCFAAVAPDGTAVHVRWVTTTRAFIPELGLDLVLNAGEAYFYNGYTRPEFRKRGIDGTMRCFIFRMLKDCGYSTVWSYVRGDNAPGLRAAERWQRRRGSVRYLRLCNSSPRVIGRRAPNLPELARPVQRRAVEADRAERINAWSAWFNGWLHQPLTKRSTGYAALPAEYFRSAADHIGSMLQLNPDADVVLDVGCDSAMISRLIAPRCRRFVGVDFIPGMLGDARNLGVSSASGEPARFAAADGRRLPFASGRFTKVYCSAVLHTLPSREDGLAMIDELIRVCASGGTVLLASVPDVRKRLKARFNAWKQSGLARKIALPFWLLVPERARRRLKRAAGLGAGDAMLFVEYDLRSIKEALESRGLVCRIIDFPSSYWSTDFRANRSNLLVEK